jgi:hypothetical protein
VVNSLLFLVSIIGLWAGSIYVPTAVTQMAIREGSVGPAVARLASYGSMVLAIGTIVGCLLAPVLAERGDAGRRSASISSASVRRWRWRSATCSTSRVRCRCTSS